jgi:hypothetical protein
MTSEEYRLALVTLTDEQRRDLNEHILKGNQPTVHQMLYTFERYPDVEPKAVFWLRQHVSGFQHITEADRVAKANIRSAELGERSLVVSQNSLNLSQKSLVAAYWALAVAVVALIVSIVAIWK